MKRSIAARLVFSDSVFAMLTRMVWLASCGTSPVRAITTICPSRTFCRPNGAAAQPTSIWPVITCVRVAGAPPVAMVFALTPACRSSASRIRFDEEPGEENETVLPAASFRLLMPLSARAYQ